MDSIDRQAALDAHCMIVCGHKQDDAICLMECPDYEVFNHLPSAQPEIIHCRDCANYQTDWIPYTMPNGHYCSIVDTMMREDEFCSRAERREDEQAG